MATTKEIISAVKAALSAPRVSTYETATGVTKADDSRAIALYAWNAGISAALLAPLHICEVVIRNAVSDAIETLYGPRWPWSPGFVRSLPTPSHPSLYDARRDLTKQARKFHTTGKVIPELKFVFWQQMFDSRHEARLWVPSLYQIFPNVDRTKTISVVRQEIHDALEQIRALRNRMAHHEPIFNRNLAQDFQTAFTLVGYRSTAAASWMLSNQNATAVLKSSRAFIGGSMWVPSQEEIAYQAYRFWEASGCPDGCAEANWYRAVEFLSGNRWWDL